MTTPTRPRRSHPITIKFHDGKFSSVHWSPPRECWPKHAQTAVEFLKGEMEAALRNGKVTDLSA